ncbi:MAG: hypothetical protein C0625_07695 [Arcobacter sp.]|nr:MAG: hypothetical protein C0625_07695 [Arcobacter sp.]
MPNENIKPTILNTVLPLGIIVLIVGGYFLIDFNGIYQSFKDKAEFISQNERCDLHKEECQITIQDGTTFLLSITPKEIPLMKPLTFSIKSNQKNLKNLKLDIYSTNMFMGEFNLDLKNLGKGYYEATGVLPTCPTGDMQWNAEIRVKKANETIGAKFKFKTDI